MKLFLGAVLGFACAVLVLVALQARSEPEHSVASAVALAPSTTTLSADLEARLATLEHELRRQALVLGALEGTARQSAASSIVAVPAPVSGDGADPRWYLEQYARSFDASGQGSEYFRLAVDAYAMQLFDELSKLVTDGGALPALRIALVRMLGTPRFAKNARALDALFIALRGSKQVPLCLALIEALQPIANEPTAFSLERVTWGLPSLEVKKRALTAILALAGPDANKSLVRLYRSALTDQDRELVVSLLSTADLDSALEVFRPASTDSLAIRVGAATSLQRFRGEALIPFVEQWISYETEQDVKRLLANLLGKLSETQPYSARKAVGPPDADPSQDHPNAWASKSPDGGEQWLLLGYVPSRRASSVRIHEVNIAGAITRVSLYDESGAEHIVWSGVDPTTIAGVFEVSFATTGYRVKSVKLVLDTSRAPGWSEIDAVELVGPDGSDWASSASASSSYAD